MATRSLIGRTNSDSSVTYIYCHWDGYIQSPGVGSVLHEHYQDSAKVDQLLALGDLSSIGPEIGEQHPFDAHYSDQDPRARWCKAYGRDRGEDGTEAKQATGAGAFWTLRREWGAEYLYLYTDGTWLARAGDESVCHLADALRTTDDN